MLAGCRPRSLIAVTKVTAIRLSAYSDVSGICCVSRDRPDLDTRRYRNVRPRFAEPAGRLPVNHRPFDFGRLIRMYTGRLWSLAGPKNTNLRVWVAARPQRSATLGRLSMGNRPV